MADVRNARIIKYLNLTFEDFVKDLKNSSRIYFPKNSRDLSEASSAEMMIENAAYVGDVLSHYLENRFQNTNVLTANDPKALVNGAAALGYRFQGPSAATGLQNFYCEVPTATGSLGNYIPDMRYAINYKNVQLQNTNGIVFEAVEDVDFSKVNISSSQQTAISRRSNTGIPTHFILKATAQVVAGKTITETFSITDYKPFKQIQISQPNVLDIVSVVDSDGDSWYEVDYLAQDSIFEGILNPGADSQDVPYLLKIKTVPKRFTKTIDPSTGKATLTFGTGKAIDVGTPIIPNPTDLAIDLKGKLTFSANFIDPQNFLKTRNLGLAPYGTTLTVQARVGGGRVTNTSENSLNQIIGKQTDFSSAGLDVAELNNTLSSISTKNTEPLTGGQEAETIKEIQQNSTAFFAAQGRLNSREDYIARTLSMPSKFGKVFRVYGTTNTDRNGGVQLYVIAKNSQDQLIQAPLSLKKNIKNYLAKYTRLNQGIDILDAKIINIAIDYSIVVASGYNKSKVKIETLNKIKDYFNINNWQLNQPIIIDEIRVLIKETEGVVSIAEFEIYNKNNKIFDNTYSEYVYDVATNTKNGIVFAKPDSIFELRYPTTTDIKVSAI